MGAAIESNKERPVISNPSNFDPSSGNVIERLIFNHRPWVIVVCVLLTIFFGAQLRGLALSASFEKTLPQSHPYIQNYLENRTDLRGLGDSVRIVVENLDGDIFDPQFLERFSEINDEIYLLPGVDRSWMKSIWTPVVRWSEVTEEGLAGGPVMPSRFDGSPQAIEQLQQNIGRAGLVGSLVAENVQSSMIVVPLLPQVGEEVSYQALWEDLKQIEARYEQDVEGEPRIKVRITGFAALSGNLIDGLTQVMWFFLAAATVALVVIYLFSRCVRSTAVILSCSFLAVVWQLGMMATLGFGLDPFSMLVPFLIFSIGVSHGAQKMNGVMQDIGRGTHRFVAARYTFRRLFITGLTALITDAVGFAVLMLIDIPVVQELALTASLGVALLVFTNLILLPVLLSYTGVSPKAAERALRADQAERTGQGLGWLWTFFDKFTQRRWAAGAVVIAVLLAVGGLVVREDLQVGDLEAGAPELRPDSDYNKDIAYINTNYGVSSDVFVVMVKTPEDQCGTFENLIELDRLGWFLNQVPGVQGTNSLSKTIRSYMSGSFEGNPKWMTIHVNERLLYPQVANAINWNSDFLNRPCSMAPVLAYLNDHKAETLNRVEVAASDFAAKHSTDDREFLLAAGSAGIAAATNIAVEEANSKMLLWIYGAVIIMTFIAFRSWRAVVVAVLPLLLTSILAEALMAMLGIGIKVATLPVVALGVGIGVDYALYLLSVQLVLQRAGLDLASAYRHALVFTGKVVGLVGVTLAAGVVTWAWSPIKFQADMGIMLTFMFLFNMAGALILIPALSHFLLAKVKATTPGTASLRTS